MFKLNFDNFWIFIYKEYALTPLDDLDEEDCNAGTRVFVMLIEIVQIWRRQKQQLARTDMDYTKYFFLNW